MNNRFYAGIRNSERYQEIEYKLFMIIKFFKIIDSSSQIYSKLEATSLKTNFLLRTTEREREYLLNYIRYKKNLPLIENKDDEIIFEDMDIYDTSWLKLKELILDDYCIDVAIRCLDDYIDNNKDMNFIIEYLKLASPEGKSYHLIFLDQVDTKLKKQKRSIILDRTILSEETQKEFKAYLLEKSLKK